MTAEFLTALAAWAALIVSIRGWFVQQDHQRQLEGVRFDLERQLHRTKLTFEREFSILSELWASLVELRNATLALRPLIERIDIDESYEDRKKRRLTAFSEKRRDFASIVHKNRPFYPKGIYDALSEILNKAADEADEYWVRDPERRPLTEEYWRNAQKNQQFIVDAVDAVCEAIRDEVFPSEPRLSSSSATTDSDSHKVLLSKWRD